MAEQQNKGGKGWLSFFLGFLIGIITGVIGWLLFVPKEVKEKAEEISDVTKEKAREIKDTAVEIKDTAVYIGEGIGQVITEYAKEGKEIIVDKAKLIKDKITGAVEVGKEAFTKKKKELMEEEEK